MLGKETIGHGDLERFHIGHRPRSLVGCCRRTGLPAIDAQFDQISVPGVAVVDPSLDHETTQPSPYPAIQILEDRQCLYQPEVPYPAAKEHTQLLYGLDKLYATGSPSDLPGVSNCIGDCQKPGKAINAISEAYTIATQI